ncbi:isoprenoid synthase domain-containing protein [Desarmillaria tabescens]|uniref:Terpene synthase n=1 Tax=Armillaria tabescens TaxID=1929756 RepID=A0AA39K040_ARMTA|nr:isoprenoid synthase domain-containing protein [Desarmillaria tabescens]KAK0452122.1 isoprenoid synthase domain-containing protein [Desarmillaria tabescens]
MLKSLAFPSSFVLPNICNITGTAFELKENQNRESANRSALAWFEKYNIYDREQAETFLNSGRFDVFAALSFPEADLLHLETCLCFFLWAFSNDDLSDEGDFQRSPEDIQNGHNVSMKILYDADAEQPTYPYAAMLWDLLKRIRNTGRMGTYHRFAQAFIDFSSSQVKQSRNRNIDYIPPIQEFILMRRCTIGAALVQAMVEYSLDLNIPDYVFDDPIVIAMSEAITDILTWPNDLCSFNKEQADGDYQNLVCVLQCANAIGLQDAINMLTNMIADRLKEYLTLKKQLPSFGPDIDAVLARYHTAMENFTQGCIVWYYSSPRYFRGINPLGKESVVIQLFESSA